MKTRPPKPPPLVEGEDEIRTEAHDLLDAALDVWISAQPDDPPSVMDFESEGDECQAKAVFTFCRV